MDFSGTAHYVTAHEITLIRRLSLGYRHRRKNLIAINKFLCPRDKSVFRNATLDFAYTQNVFFTGKRVRKMGIIARIVFGFDCRRYRQILMPGRRDGGDLS